MSRPLNYPSFEAIEQESYKEHGPGCCMSMCALYKTAVSELVILYKDNGYMKSPGEVHEEVIEICKVSEGKI